MPLVYTGRMGFKTYTCPISASCGGCEWLAVPYPIQLRRKREEVERLFADLLGDGGVEIHGMDEPTGYRHKAATPFAPGTHGRIRSGFYAKGTHRIVPCASCLVEDPRCRKVLNAVARAAEEEGVSAYEEDHGRGCLRHAIVRAGWSTDELLLTLVTNGQALPHTRELVGRIRELSGCVTSVAQNVNQRRTNAMLGPRSTALMGPGVMHDSLLGVSFEIGPASFYQTNPQQTEVLYRLAIEAAGLTSGMRLLDAYCGIGTIGLAAAASTEGLEVVGVERGEEAVACARRNAEANGLGSRVRFVCADATGYMRDARKGREAFDVVVLDPPRTGSTKAFLESAVALVPQSIVYVSCNPETQRRDVDVLIAGGYRLADLQVVDMFPHTKHAESVAVLTR